MRPDFERAERIGVSGAPRDPGDFLSTSRKTRLGELSIDMEGDNAMRAVVVGLLLEVARAHF